MNKKYEGMKATKMKLVDDVKIWTWHWKYFPIKIFFVKNFCLKNALELEWLWSDSEQQGDGALFLGRKIQSGGEVFPHKKYGKKIMVEKFFNSEILNSRYMEY